MGPPVGPYAGASSRSGPKLRRHVEDEILLGRICVLLGRMPAGALFERRNSVRIGHRRFAPLPANRTAIVITPPRADGRMIGQCRDLPGKQSRDGKDGKMAA